MAGTGLDEGVGNLQAFIAGLAQGVAALQEAESGLEKLQGDLETLEGEVQEVIGDLVQTLDDAVDALQQAEEDARAAIGTLEQGATDGAGELVDIIAEPLEDESRASDESAAAGRAALEADFTRLRDEGYEAHGHALESAGADLSAAGETCGSGFSALEASLDGGQERVETASDALESATDEDAREMGEDTATLTAALKEGRADWEQSIEAALQTACEEIGQTLETGYESWAADAVETASEWAEQMGERIARAAAVVGESSVASVRRAVAGGLDTPGEALQAQIVESQEALEAGTAVTEDLGRLSPDLQGALGVVDEVDRLLNAMA